MDRNLTLPDIYQTATKPPRDGCVTNNRLERTVVALPYDYLVIAWFAIALISTAYVAYDQFAGNPEPTVVKWASSWSRCTWGQWASCSTCLPTKSAAWGVRAIHLPTLEAGGGSTIHCVAGDATGIIVAAATTALLGLPMWIDLIVEYLAGFSSLNIPVPLHEAHDERRHILAPPR